MRRLVLLCAAFAPLFAATPDELVKRVAAYEFGGDVSAVRELEALTLWAAEGKDTAAIEQLLIAGLDSARTLAARDAFCRDLAIAGSDRAVPKLSSLLAQPETAEMARYALERIPGARSAAALRGALARSLPADRIGIIISLGRRRDVASVGAITPWLANGDAPLADASAAALGRIATAAARTALLAARPSAAVCDALLAIAEQSGATDAADIYRRLAARDNGDAVRGAALAGLARVDPKAAAPLLRGELKGESARLRSVAILELVRLDSVGLAKEMPSVQVREQVQIIYALAGWGRPEVRAVLLAAAASTDDAVRTASLRGLGKLGTAADVPMLAIRSATAKGDEQMAARASLGAIPGQAVDDAILRAMNGAEPKIKVELIRAAGERGSPSAAAVLLASCRDTDRTVRIESIRALREVAGPNQVSALLGLLLKTSAAAERKELERTVASTIRRSGEGAVSAVVQAYGQATDLDVRVSLLNILSAVGSPAALPAIRQALQDPSSDLQRAAITALAGWPTPEPLDELLTLARSANNPVRQTLAVRGYIKLLEAPSKRTPAETAGLLKTAMQVAIRPEEKKAALAVAQRIVCSETLELARAALADPQIAAEAQLAVTTLERQLKLVGR